MYMDPVSPTPYLRTTKLQQNFYRVFRLGKMIGVKGPGRVLIFPWMDRTKCIDVRAAAFAVPPQQFITCDGGIVEMGAEIQVYHFYQPFLLFSTFKSS